MKQTEQKKTRYAQPQVEEVTAATEDVMEGSTDNEQLLGELLNNLGTYARFGPVEIREFRHLRKTKQRKTEQKG